MGLARRVLPGPQGAELPAGIGHTVIDALDQPRAVADEQVPAAVTSARTPPGHDEHLFPLISGGPGRNEGTAALGRLDDQHGIGQAGHQTVASGEHP